MLQCRRNFMNGPASSQALALFPLNLANNRYAAHSLRRGDDDLNLVEESGGHEPYPPDSQKRSFQFRPTVDGCQFGGRGSRQGVKEKDRRRKAVSLRLLSGTLRLCAKS